MRGIQKRLDEIEAAAPACAAFVAMARDLARGFQLDALHNLIGRARNA